MTPSSVEHFPFDGESVSAWAQLDGRHINWPVVYLLDGEGQQSAPDVYVGETVNAASRVRQHLGNPEKRRDLRGVRVVIDDTFNKSACQDLESHLIRWLAGDGRFTVLNRNEGVVDAAYYDRSRYRSTFQDIFDQLHDEGLFTRSIPEIENSALFKLSPFKALTQDQAIAVEDILDGLFDDLATRETPAAPAVIQGDPGTGKTIVAIFLMKLLADIRFYRETEEVEPDSVFADLFVPENRELLSSFRMGLVVPQQSLRQSIKNVFRRTPRLDPSMVLSPFEVGKSSQGWDLLVVDEAHRLTQRANQSSGMLNRQYIDANVRLFGSDSPSLSQLDWIRKQSGHQLFLVDAAQSVRPADLPADVLELLIGSASAGGRRYPLTSQMRVRAGSNWVTQVRRMLAGEATPVRAGNLGHYELRLFDDAAELVTAIRAKDAEFGLARLVAGYAWEWKSRRDPLAADIALDGVALRWNSEDRDWINSPGALDEVGSIHTVQGYDLNYAGVIIGPELRYDPAAERVYIDRHSYKDAKGKENNTTLGKTYTDVDLQRFITNVYGVLLTRGIRGTFIYVCDPGLREYVRGWLGQTDRRIGSGTSRA